MIFSCSAIGQHFLNYLLIICFRRTIYELTSFFPLLVLFPPSKYFIELSRIKKCGTNKGGIFVLDEFGKQYSFLFNFFCSQTLQIIPCTQLPFLLFSSHAYRSLLREVHACIWLWTWLKSYFDLSLVSFHVIIFQNWTI